MAAAPRFGLFGIPIKVDPFFAIVLLFFGFVMYGPRGGQYVVSFAVIAALSVFVHELGHALAFKAYGIQPSITLYGMGGLTSGNGNLSPQRNIVITLAGPLPPLLLIGLPAMVWANSPGHTTDVVLEQVVFVNVVWSILNLLPVLPLDGGVVTASVFELLFQGKGRQIANVISLVLVGVLAVVGLSIAQPFLLVMAVLFGLMNIRELTSAREGASSTGADPLAEAYRALLQGQPQMAEYLAHEALVNARDLESQRWANELLAWARLFSGDTQGAQQRVAVMSPSRPPSQSLLGSLALAAGRRDEGITVLAWSLAREAAGPATSLAAVAAARAGVTDEVARELRAMGPEGTEAAQLFQQLLDYAGFHEQAQAVATRSSLLPPGHFGAPDPPDHLGDDRDRSPTARYGSVTGSSPISPASGAPWPPSDHVHRPPPPGAPPPAAESPSVWPEQPPSSPPVGPSPWTRPDHSG